MKGAPPPGHPRHEKAEDQHPDQQAPTKDCSTKKRVPPLHATDRCDSQHEYRIHIIYSGRLKVPKACWPNGACIPPARGVYSPSTKFPNFVMARICISSCSGAIFSDCLCPRSASKLLELTLCRLPVVSRASSDLYGHARRIRERQALPQRPLDE